MTFRPSRQARAVLWQALAIALLAAVLWGLFETAFDNMARRGIRSGFDFLGSEAGFDIIQSLIAYGPSSSYGRAFLVGLLNTILVAAIGVVLATVLGVLIGVGRLSRNWLVATMCTAYVETVRNVPLLLQIFIWYFAVLRTLPPPRGSLEFGGAIFLNNRGLYLPWPVAGDAAAISFVAAAVLSLAAWQVRRGARRTAYRRSAVQILSGLAIACAVVAGATLDWDMPRLAGFNFRGGVAVIPEFTALVVALSTYTAAFIAENVRAGIAAVPRGQVEAGRALGLGERQILWRIVLPQAVRVIVPPVTNQYLNLTKNSSLAAAIAYPDLVSVFAGTVLNQTGQAIEVIAITMGVYLSLSIAIAAAMNLYNGRVTRRAA